MAVRVTAGRITIVAALAVALAGVQFSPAFSRVLRGSALTGQASTPCVISGSATVDATIGVDAPLTNDFPLPPNTYIQSITPASMMWCRRLCSYCPTSCTDLENLRCLGEGVVDGCAQPPEYCTSVKVQYVGPQSGSDPGGAASGMTGPVPNGVTGLHLYVGDSPNEDNGGTCTLNIVYTTTDPSCANGSSSAAASTTPTSSAGGTGGTGGGSAGTGVSSPPSSQGSSATSATSAASSYSSSIDTGTTGGGGTGGTGGGSSVASTPSSSSSRSSSSSSVYVPTSAASSYLPTSRPSSFSSYSSTTSSSGTTSSSSSSGYCGDEIVDEETEECDLGDLNGQSGINCNVDCSNARCGDEYTQEWLNEQCDDGDVNALKQDIQSNNVEQGPLTSTWCSLACQRPECSNGIDQADFGLQGGFEDVPDAATGAPKDFDDGGCYLRECDFGSQYLPGKQSENNPCELRRVGGMSSQSTVTPTKSVGQSCGESAECMGDRVYCMSRGSRVGSCTDYSGGGTVTANLLAQAGGLPGFNPPPCPPGALCGFMVGNEAACPGGQDGTSCADQRARKQCLYNTAVAMGQCPGGEIVPVPIGAEWKCTQDPNNQLMCGPAGQWYCKCPGENPPLWAEQLRQCGPKCGDRNVDPGEQCDDGNQVNNDQCTNTCRNNVGGQCTGNECQNPAAVAACAAQNNAVCQQDPQLPCIKCIPPVGGQCTGRECAEGGDAAAAAQGMECSLIPNFPCITFIPPNSCGNGEIDIVPPQVVDEGCEVMGTAGQYCVSEGMVIDDFGIFQPVHQCFASAHCSNTGGRCAWEMTPDLQQCIEDAVGEQPVIARLIDMALDPFRAQVADPLDDGGMIPVICPTTDVKLCCQNGELVYMSRDPANRCQFTGCNEDLTACLTPENRCVRGGCQGELCVPLGDTTNTQCTHDPKNMCYASATCAWTGSACAWTQSPQLLECLSDNANSTCPTDQSCLSRGACADQGGTAGNACGAADTNVCCGGIGPDIPVEECDDGNRVDDDACGNDCRINCRVNADCPEGACVNGQCVDQCAAPVVNDPDPPADPSGYTYCDINGTNICPAGANACRDNKCYSTGLGMFVDDAPCSCGNLPMLQGSITADPFSMHASADGVDYVIEFLPRLMARGDFSLLP